MTNLLEQFKGHIINQTLTNKLSEIEILLSEYELNELQEESVLAYQLLLQNIKVTLNAKSLPIVPKIILDNLNSSIENLSRNAMFDINSYYSQYQNLIDHFNRLPRFEKKSEVKESFNTLISNFLKQQDHIKYSVDEELSNFQDKQNDSINKWNEEKVILTNELEELKQENVILKKEIDAFKKNITKQDERLSNIVSTYEHDFRRHIQDYDYAFQTKLNEYKDLFKNMLNDKEEETDDTLEHINTRKNDIEKLWGIIGKSATVGNASFHANEAKNFANIMMGVTVLLMCIGLVYIGIATWKLFQGQYVYTDFVWKVITSAIILIPALYCANISKRQRDREFQLRDFELKTAALEPFMENMKLENESNPDDAINKDKVKLELTKTFFDHQFGNKPNDCVLLPKEVTKILNALAKKCNFNINIGDKE